MGTSAAPIKDTLRGCSLFRGLMEDQLDHIVPFCVGQEVSRDSILFREGEPARYVHVVERGVVALQMALHKPTGGFTKPATVAMIGPHTVFGWSALVEPHVSTLSAVAVRASRLVLVDGDKLNAFLVERPEIGYKIMAPLAKLLSERLAQTREMLLYERGLAMVD